MANERKNIRKESIVRLLLGIAIIVLVNIVGSFLFYRLDLTTEKRYTLAPSTRKMLKDLDDIVYFKVYLDGEFPAGFKRLRNETREMLNEFRAFSKNIQFEFINPSASSDKKVNEAMYRQLIEAGLNPTDLQVRNSNGVSRQLIFPGAIVSYKGRELPLELLGNQLGTAPNDVLNNSVESLEYNLANVIHKFIMVDKPRIAFIEGHGELDPVYTADIEAAFKEYYVVDRVRIDGQLSSLTVRTYPKKDSSEVAIVNKYKAIIIAKPDSVFSDKDKFIIDQFVMRGGKVLWLVDPVYATMDSLQRNDQTIGVAHFLNLDDMFFNYGVRLNPDLIVDLNALKIPIVTGRVGNQPKTDFFPWYFFPVILPQNNHPIARNLNAIKFEFVSSMDTLDSPGVKSTVLLSSSKYSRVLDAPVLITLQMLRTDPDPSKFNNPNKPVAVLLEGNFVSLFLNRIPPEISGSPEIGFLDKSKNTQMIIVSDGDVIKNQLQPGAQGLETLPCGYDRYSGQQFGNRDFLLNCMNYLCDDGGLLSVRSRDIKLRLLDGSRVSEEKAKWQVINTIVPVMLVVLFGVGQYYVRKRKYGRK